MADNREPHPLSKVELDVKRVENDLVGILEIHGRKIPVPGWINEIEGAEDFLTVVKNSNLFNCPHIISIPSFKWKNIATCISPLDSSLNESALELFSTHHIIMYEPPELFHNLMPQKVVTHALGGNRVKAREFYRKALIENDKESALNLLPSFEREFIKLEWDDLMNQRYKSMVARNAKSLSKIKNVPKKPDKSVVVDDAWTMTKESYLDHVLNGALEARKYSSASYVPAIRTLTASSTKSDRSFVIKQNKYTDFLWDKVLEGQFYPTGRIWFHVSLSYSVLNGTGETGIGEIIDIVNKSFSPTSHAGICYTIDNWEKAFLSEPSRKNLQLLTREISDIAIQHKLPLYGARSKWVGLFLVDDGLSFPGAMINGAERLSSGGGMSSTDPKAFGRIAAYGFCKDMKITDLFEEGSALGDLSKPRRLHHLDGVPDHCSVELQNDAKRFRMEFGKLRNFATHLQEIREIRYALEKGQRKPAQEYIKKSLLWKGIR